MYKKVLMSFILILISPSFVGTAYSEEKELSKETIEGAETIDSLKAKELFDNEVAFVDPRKDSDYDAGRIPGAIHLDSKTNLTEEALMAEVAKDEEVVFYCNGVKCRRSANAAEKAVSWGYEKVYYYREGFPIWKQSGYPVE